MWNRIRSAFKLFRGQRALLWGLIALLCFLILAGRVHAPVQEVRALPTETPTQTPADTPTPTLTPSATLSPTAVPTRTPSPTATPTLPRIVGSYPIDGDRSVPRDAAIVIALSGAVDRQQIEAAFVFSPTLAGELSWLDPQRVSFRPQSLAPDTPYTLHFSLRHRGGLEAGEALTATFASAGGGAPIPILMYHHIRELGPEASKAEQEWAVSPAEFARQLAYLKQKGYHSIDFAQLMAYFKQREPLPPRPLIISLDDGYVSAFDVAAPLLKAYGMIANIFALPGNVGYPAYLTWEQMIQLRQEGHHFGSHTLNHANLLKVGRVEAMRQLSQSKAVLEEKLGQPVIAFCYPLGGYNAEVISWVREAGYQAACSLELGYLQRPQKDGLYHLWRIWVGYHTTLEELGKKLPW